MFRGVAHLVATALLLASTMGWAKPAPLPTEIYGLKLGATLAQVKQYLAKTRWKFKERVRQRKLASGGTVLAVRLMAEVPAPHPAKRIRYAVYGNRLLEVRVYWRTVSRTHIASLTARYGPPLIPGQNSSYWMDKRRSVGMVANERRMSLGALALAMEVGILTPKMLDQKVAEMRRWIKPNPSSKPVTRTK